MIAAEQNGGDIVETECSDVGMSDLPALPEDAAAAWASVLLDVWQKQQGEKVVSRKQADAALDAPQGGTQGINSDGREPT